MPNSTITRENETLDGVIYRIRGSVNSAMLEAAYALNPEIESHGTVLPAGLQIMVPDASNPVKPLLKLWD